MMLSDFDITKTVHRDGTGYRYNLNTDMALTNSTTFFLHADFTGRYEKGCGLTFNILDDNTESMCHLDFRIYVKNRYRAIIQDFKYQGQWGWVTGQDIETDLPDLSKISEIYIVVTPEVFEVSINNVVLEPQLPVQFERFDSYAGLSIQHYGECFAIDLEKSFMNNGVGYLFGLADESGNEKVFGKYSEPLLLSVRQAGLSEIGSVCGTYFSSEVASLVCQQMGYRSAISWSNRGDLGEDSYPFPVFMERVECREDSESLFECNFVLQGDGGTCGHDQDVFLQCDIGEESCGFETLNGFMKTKCYDFYGDEFYKCPHSEIFYTVDAALPAYSQFSALCEEDPKFYQVCGAGHEEMENNGQDDDLACSYFICDLEDGRGIFTSGWLKDKNIRCNGDHQCRNTDYDEKDCDEVFTGTANDTFSIQLSEVCDGTCDMITCFDESKCNGYDYGKRGEDLYYAPIHIGRVPNYPAIIFGEDEELKYPELPTCQHSFSNLTVPIFDFNRCAAMIYNFIVVDISEWVLEPWTPYCSNLLDQTNCTDSTRVALTCDIDGYPSTVSHYVVCHNRPNLKVCDNGIEDMCLPLSATCFVHKHVMCDGVIDCADQSDENSEECLSMTEDSSCFRVLGGRRGPIPLAWLDDSVVDCVSGKDESGTDMWPTCGVDDTFRFVVENGTCYDDFLCLNSETKFIRRESLCDKIDTCGNENEICRISRGVPTLFTTAHTFNHRDKHLMHCLKGLSSLEELKGPCVSQPFLFPTGTIYGMTSLPEVVIPLEQTDCNNMYGENYVYMTCTGRCINSPCPLQRHLNHNSCPGYVTDRIYTLFNNEQLTFVTKKRDYFRNDYFLCENDRKCISYDKVCDLVNDCGDGSDEEMCTNHFKCTSPELYIAKSQVCDGNIDCPDLSDECNERCGAEIINGVALKIFSWAVGTLAVLFNIIILYKGVRELSNNTSTVALLNKLLILTIGLGDFITGAYLLIMSIMDRIHGGEYCVNQVRWIISNWCTTFGVLSTIGSQMSLFSMTILSILRCLGIRNPMLLSHEHSRPKKAAINITVILLVIIVSTLIAITPILPGFEDYFVNGLSYDEHNPMFIGMTTKDEHFHMITSYYGRAKHKTLSWELTRTLTAKMFSNNYNGVWGKHVTFYGNDGVCLFKYFVLMNDPQKMFTWMTLMVNFTCFVVISGSYLYINYQSIKSSRKLHDVGKDKQVRKNKLVAKRNQKLQRKVSIIILTDFLCWIPFIFVSGLHTLGIIDASPQYAFFSIVVLPINCVINPLLYDTTVSNYLTRALGSMKSYVTGNEYYTNVSSVAIETIRRVGTRINTRKQDTTAARVTDETVITNIEGKDDICQISEL